MEENAKFKYLRLDEILQQKKMTNREFARRMGKSPQYTNAIVKGRSGASVVMLSKMADALGVSVRELFVNTKKQRVSCG